MALVHRTLALLLGACVGMAILLGCDETDHDKLEHESPPHRPANYSAAITRLNELHAEIKEGRQRDGDELDAFSEAHDIARWLPEIAADSDLPESPWMRIFATTEEMRVILDDVVAHGEGSRREAYLSRETRLGELNEDLRAVSQEFPHPDDQSSTP